MAATAPYSPGMNFRIRAALDALGKEAYGIYAHRVGRGTAYEHLSNLEREAFTEIARYFQDEPECCTCTEPIICVNCEGDYIRELIEEGSFDTKEGQFVALTPDDYVMRGHPRTEGEYEEER